MDHNKDSKLLDPLAIDVNGNSLGILRVILQEANPQQVQVPPLKFAPMDNNIGHAGGILYPPGNQRTDDVPPFEGLDREPFMNLCEAEYFAGVQNSDINFFGNAALSAINAALEEGGALLTKNTAAASRSNSAESIAEFDFPPVPAEQALPSGNYPLNGSSTAPNVPRRTTPAVPNDLGAEFADYPNSTVIHGSSSRKRRISEVFENEEQGSQRVLKKNRRQYQGRKEPHSEIISCDTATTANFENFHLSSTQTPAGLSLVERAISLQSAPDTGIQVNPVLNSTSEISTIQDIAKPTANFTHEHIAPIAACTDLPEPANYARPEETVQKVTVVGQFSFQTVRIVDPPICQHCQKPFPGEQELALHVKKTHSKNVKRKSEQPGKKEIVCRRCGQIFKNDVNLRRHISRVHVGKITDSCGTCGATFSSRHGFVSHRRDMHRFVPDSVKKRCGGDVNSSSGPEQKGRGVPKNGWTIHRCGSCNHWTNTKGNMVRHIGIIHVKLREHKCDICDKLSPTKNNLQVHRSSMHPETDRLRNSQASSGTVYREEEGGKRSRSQ